MGRAASSVSWTLCNSMTSPLWLPIWDSLVPDKVLPLVSAVWEGQPPEAAIYGTANPQLLPITPCREENLAFKFW
jgi:hypothetical protein